MTTSIDRRLARLESLRAPRSKSPKMVSKAQRHAALMQRAAELRAQRFVAPTWQADRVESLLDGRSLVMRVRVSPPSSGRVELYYRGDLPPVANGLVQFGWKRTAEALALPPGVRGFVYRHDGITPECYRRTRDLLEAHTAERIPTISLPKLPEPTVEKLEWTEPYFTEFDVIRRVPGADTGLFAGVDHGDIFEIEKRETYIFMFSSEGQFFEFDPPVSLGVGVYYAEIEDDRLELGALDGDFSDILRVKAVT